MTLKKLALPLLPLTLLPLAACAPQATVDNPNTTQEATPTQDSKQNQEEALKNWNTYTELITGRDKTVAGKITQNVGEAVAQHITPEEAQNLTNHEFLRDFFATLTPEKQALLAESALASLPQESLNHYNLDGMSDAEKADFAVRLSLYEGAAALKADGQIQKDFRTNNKTEITETDNEITFVGLISSVYTKEGSKVGDVPAENFHPITFVKTEEGWKVNASAWANDQIEQLKASGRNDHSQDDVTDEVLSQ